MFSTFFVCHLKRMKTILTLGPERNGAHTPELVKFEFHLELFLILKQKRFKGPDSRANII